MCPLVNFAPASNDQAFSMPPPDFFHDYTILYKYNAKNAFYNPNKGKDPAKKHFLVSNSFLVGQASINWFIHWTWNT